MDTSYHDVSSIHVETIVDTKTEIVDNGFVRFYRVQWKSSWETEASLLKFCSNIINDYWKDKTSCPGKPSLQISALTENQGNVSSNGLPPLHLIANSTFNPSSSTDTKSQSSTSFNVSMLSTSSKVVPPLPSLFSPHGMISPLFGGQLSSNDRLNAVPISSQERLNSIIKENESNSPASTPSVISVNINNKEINQSIHSTTSNLNTASIRNPSIVSTPLNEANKPTVVSQSRSSSDLPVINAISTDSSIITSSTPVTSSSIEITLDVPPLYKANNDFHVISSIAKQDPVKLDAAVKNPIYSVIAKVEEGTPLTMDVEKDEINIETSKEHDYATSSSSTGAASNEQDKVTILVVEDSNGQKVMETKGTQTDVPPSNRRKRPLSNKKAPAKKPAAKKTVTKKTPAKKASTKAESTTSRSTPRKRTPRKIIKAEAPGDDDLWEEPPPLHKISDTFEDEREIEIPDMDEDGDEDEEDYLDWTSSEGEEADSDDTDYDPSKEGGVVTESDHEIKYSDSSENPIKSKPKKAKKPRVPRPPKQPKGNFPLTKCDECGKEHMKSSCPRCIKRKTCEVCGHRYVNKCTKCAYTCEQCGKICWKSYRLKQHIETIHDKIKKYKCDTCGLLFVAKSRLIRHRDVHKAAPDLICNICQKAFRHRTTFYRHRKIHSGVKPYKCPVCNRDFQQKEAMKTHQRIHNTGPKRFKCLLCEKDFNHKVSLKEHMQKHHNKDEQQAAVMIGLWKKYQMEEGGAVLDTPNPEILLNRALNAVAMKPLDGGIMNNAVASQPMSIPPPPPPSHIQQLPPHSHPPHQPPHMHPHITHPHVSLVDFPYLDFAQHEIQIPVPLSYDPR